MGAVGTFLEFLSDSCITVKIQTVQKARKPEKTRLPFTLIPIFSLQRISMLSTHSILFCFCLFPTQCILEPVSE